MDLCFSDRKSRLCSAENGSPPRRSFRSSCISGWTSTYLLSHAFVHSPLSQVIVWRPNKATEVSCSNHYILRSLRAARANQSRATADESDQLSSRSRHLQQCCTEEAKLLLASPVDSSGTANHFRGMRRQVSSAVAPGACARRGPGHYLVAFLKTPRDDHSKKWPMSPPSSVHLVFLRCSSDTHLNPVVISC